MTRLPMTFAAQERAMRELRLRAPDFRPETLLDFGAGPAPALWAARCVFGSGESPSLDASVATGAGRGKTTLVDASPSMMAFTRRVAKAVYDDEDLERLGEGMEYLSKPSGRPMPEPSPWGDTGPVRTMASLRALSPKASLDLIVAAYSSAKSPRGRDTSGSRGARGRAGRRRRSARRWGWIHARKRSSRRCGRGSPRGSADRSRAGDPARVQTRAARQGDDFRRRTRGGEARGPRSESARRGPVSARPRLPDG